MENESRFKEGPLLSIQTTNGVGAGAAVEEEEEEEETVRASGICVPVRSRCLCVFRDDGCLRVCGGVKLVKTIGYIRNVPNPDGCCDGNG